MAHKKSGGRAKNGRDSNPKYLGIKYFEGEFVKPGTIIVRQRGTKVIPGLNTLLARDYSILATIEGVVKFEDYRGKKRVSVYPKEI